MITHYGNEKIRDEISKDVENYLANNKQVSYHTPEDSRYNKLVEELNMGKDKWEELGNKPTKLDIRLLICGEG